MSFYRFFEKEIEENPDVLHLADKSSYYYISEYYKNKVFYFNINKKI